MSTADAVVLTVLIAAFPLYYGWERWLEHREIMADKRTSACACAAPDKDEEDGDDGA